MTKKLDIKIRETKDLEADGLVSTKTVATWAMMARMKSSVKVARHMWAVEKNLAAGHLFGGSIALPLAEGAEDGPTAE